MKIEKFEIDVPQIAIDALRERLAATRWSPEIGNDDWCLGVNGSYLRELMDYWQNDFDWRTQEAEINRFP